MASTDSDSANGPGIPVSGSGHRRGISPADPSIRSIARTGEDGDPGPVDTTKVLKGDSYRQVRVTGLLSRYARVRGDVGMERRRLHDASAEDNGHLALCVQWLSDVKQQLESRFPKLALCSNLLGLAERELVSLYPVDTLEYRARGVLQQLSAVDRSPNRDSSTQFGSLSAELNRFREVGGEASTSTLRAAMKDALVYVHGVDESALIEDDLRVGRLGRMIFFVAIAWLAMLFAAPVVAGPTTVNGSRIWPVFEIFVYEYGNLLLAGLALSVVGAVGGIISGTFALRDAPTTLVEYRASMLKFMLKPLVGAVAALIVYLLLAAGIVPGLQVTRSGIFVAAAFLAGFSERYFLRVVNAQESALAKNAGSIADSARLPSDPRT